MTTYKIRAAAQALWDAVDARHDQPAPLKYTVPYGAVVALGAALAEPAQPAPAADIERLTWGARQAMLDYGKARVDGDEEAVRDSTTRACAAIDALKAAATPPNHLAAMEALRQEVAYHEAQDGLLSKAQDEAARLRSELAEVKRPLDAQMARLNENLITANEQAAALRQEVAWLKADRSTQVAEVMHAVDEFSVAAGMSAIGVAEGVVRGSPDHAILEQRFNRKREAVEAAVRKLAEGA